jgi:hypothetical protein
MNKAKTEIVHNVKRWDSAKGDFVLLPTKRTSEWAVRVGEIVDGTAETVDASLVDGQGRYRPDSQLKSSDLA